MNTTGMSSAGRPTTLPEWMQRWMRCNPMYAWRMVHNVSREEVAALVGVSHVTVRSWELGFISPRADALGRIARMMEITPKKLGRELETWREDKSLFVPNGKPDGKAGRG